MPPGRLATGARARGLTCPSVGAPAAGASTVGGEGTATTGTVIEGGVGATGGVGALGGSAAVARGAMLVANETRSIATRRSDRRIGSSNVTTPASGRANEQHSGDVAVLTRLYFAAFRGRSVGDLGTARATLGSQLDGNRALDVDGCARIGEHLRRGWVVEVPHAERLAGRGFAEMHGRHADVVFAE